MKKKEKIWKKRVTAAVLFGVISLSLVACSMETNDTVSMDYVAQESYYEVGMSSNGAGYATNDSHNMIMEDAVEVEATTDAKGNTADVTTNRKLIRTVSMEVETEDFENMISNVEDKVDSLGGYIESAYTYNGSTYNNYHNRHAEMTVRVPDAELENFVEQVTGFSNVVSKTTTTEDITLEYVDTEGLKEMYIAEETSLLALLEKAETIEDISYLTTRDTTLKI